MTNSLNITKDYIIDKTYQESLRQLNTIVSTPFNNSKFSTFGNFISPDPHKFIFMAKWFSIGRPFFAEIVLTKISATLYKFDDKTKISTTTKTNQIIVVFFFLFLTVALVSIFTQKNSEDVKLSAIFFGFAIATLMFDRFIKNILIASFERDIKVKTT